MKPDHQVPPKYEPMAWVYDRVACLIPQPDPDAKKRLRQEHLWASENWFHEYIRCDHRGHVKAEINGPFKRKSTQAFCQKVEDLLSAYDMLFLDSAQTTCRDALFRLKARNIPPEVLLIPSTWPLENPFLGVEVTIVSGFKTHSEAVWGALSPPEFGAASALSFKPEIWGWINEGPLAILSRFGV